MAFPSRLIRGSSLSRSSCRYGGKTFAAEHVRRALGPTRASAQDTNWWFQTHAAAVRLGLLGVEFCSEWFGMNEPKQVAFEGTTAQDLSSWLEGNGVDVSLYGRGTSKTVEELLHEVRRGESVLQLSPDGMPLRIVRVLSLLIRNSRGEVLIEEQQIRPNGSVRSRGLPLSEKLVGMEDWRSAIHRAVREELGSILPENPQITVNDGSYRQTVESSVSVSYPQLRCQYQCHRVEVQVEGLPTAGKFVTLEKCKNGVLQLHWAWKANWQAS